MILSSSLSTLPPLPFLLLLIVGGRLWMSQKGQHYDLESSHIIFSSTGELFFPKGTV